MFVKYIKSPFIGLHNYINTQYQKQHIDQLYWNIKNNTHWNDGNETDIDAIINKINNLISLSDIPFDINKLWSFNCINIRNIEYHDSILTLAMKYRYIYINLFKYLFSLKGKFKVNPNIICYYY